jgi:hypothetical protein
MDSGSGEAMSLQGQVVIEQTVVGELVVEEVEVVIETDGVPGPAGAPGAGAASTVTGVINSANTIWILPHNLDMAGPEEINPNRWYFEDQDGNEIEPDGVHYINSNSASVTWPVPYAGRWAVS